MYFVHKHKKARESFYLNISMRIAFKKPNLESSIQTALATCMSRAKERYQYTTSVDINNAHYKRLQSLSESHATCAASLLESRE